MQSVLVICFPWPADGSEPQETATGPTAAAGRCQILLKAGKLKAPAEVGVEQGQARDDLGEKRPSGNKGCWWLWALVTFAWQVLGAELRGNGHSGRERSPIIPRAPSMFLQQGNINESCLILGNICLCKAESSSPSQGGGGLYHPILGGRNHAWGLPHVQSQMQVPWGSFMHNSPPTSACAEQTPGTVFLWPAQGA